jgi:hypothetical protein
MANLGRQVPVVVAGVVMGIFLVIAIPMVIAGSVILGGKSKSA